MRSAKKIKRKPVKMFEIYSNIKKKSFNNALIRLSKNENTHILRPFDTLSCVEA